MPFNKDYNGMLEEVADNFDDPIRQVEKAMEQRGFRNFSLWDHMDDVYLLRTTEIGGEKRVSREPLSHVLKRFEEIGTENSKTLSDKERLERDKVAIGKSILVGGLFFHDTDTNKIYAMGMSNMEAGKVVAYNDMNGYIPRLPEKPSLIKRILSTIGFFRDEVEQYDRDLADYRDDMQNFHDQAKYADFNDKAREDLAASKAAEEKERELAAERKKAPETRKIFDREMESIDKVLASRQNAKRPSHVRGKLEALAESDPIRASRNAKMNEAIEDLVYGIPRDRHPVFKAVQKYFGDAGALTEMIPTEGVPAKEDAGKLFDVIVSVSLDMANDRTPSQETRDKLKDVLEKNIAILNKNFEKAGIAGDTRIFSGTPGVGKVMTAAAENRKRAEITAKAAGILAEQCGRGSAEYVSFKAIQNRAKGISELCGDCMNLDGSIREPVTLAQKIDAAEQGMGLSDKQWGIYDAEKNSLRDVRPLTPYQELQEASLDRDTPDEVKQRLAAEVVVSVMGEASPWPEGVDPRAVSERVAASKDFQKLVQDRSSDLSEAVRSGDFLKRVGEIMGFKPGLQVQSPQVQAPQTQRQMAGPSL